MERNREEQDHDAGILYLNEVPPNGEYKPREIPQLVDEWGPIPKFDPIKLDENGRMLPMSKEEETARREAFLRALRYIGTCPDNGPSLEPLD